MVSLLIVTLFNISGYYGYPDSVHYMNLCYEDLSVIYSYLILCTYIYRNGYASKVSAITKRFDCDIPAFCV